MSFLLTQITYTNNSNSNRWFSKIGLHRNRIFTKDIEIFNLVQIYTNWLLLYSSRSQCQPIGGIQNI